MKMGSSLSHGRLLDVGDIGIARQDLPPLDAGPVDPHAWFDATGSPATPPAGPAARPPLELEIGSGKGTFLVQQAARRPDTRFLGLEYAAAYWRYAADRCRRHRLGNVRIVRAEAFGFLHHYMPDAALAQAHIYYPDPWPKARHHKRRLIREPTLRELHRVLEPDGRVHIATDHTDYFHWMLEQLERVPDRFQRTAFDPPGTGEPGEAVGTNFERKYRREGRPFHAMTLVRL